MRPVVWPARAVAAAALAAVCVRATPVAADPAPMSAGASPAPVTDAVIALDREDLLLSVSKKDVRVTATLVLRNPGEATKLTVGFPCEPKLEPEVAAALPCSVRPTVKASRKTLRARRSKGAEPHWVWPMTFPAGQSVELVVSYRVAIVNERYDVPFNGLGALVYRLKTGARWAGPIGKLEMRIELPSDMVVSLTPVGAVREHGVITWSKTDFEPDSDVILYLHPMWTGRFGAAAKADTGPAWADAVRAGKVDKDRVRRQLAELRHDLDDLLKYPAWFHGVATSKLGLPVPDPAEVAATVKASLELLDDVAR